MVAFGEKARDIIGRLAMKVVLGRNSEGSEEKMKPSVSELAKSIAVDVKSLKWPGHWDSPHGDMRADGTQEYYKSVADGTQVFADLHNPTFLKKPNNREVFNGADSVNNVNGTHNHGNFEFQLNKNGNLAHVVLEGPLVPGADAENIDVEEFAVKSVEIGDFEKPQSKIKIGGGYYNNFRVDDTHNNTTRVKHISYSCEDKGLDGASVTKEIVVEINGWESEFNNRGSDTITFVLKRNNDEQYDLYTRKNETTWDGKGDDEFKDTLVKKLNGTSRRMVNRYSGQEMKIEAKPYPYDHLKNKDTNLLIQIGEEKLELWLPTIGVKETMEKAAEVSKAISK